jgi:hypothetical protein
LQILFQCDFFTAFRRRKEVSMELMTEALAEARQKAQDAQSRGRLSSDPDLKRHWQMVADDWCRRIVELEAAASVKRSA